MKKFKVTVDGQSYTVEVEELKSQPNQNTGSASRDKDIAGKPNNNVSKPEAQKAETVTAPQAEEKENSAPPSSPKVEGGTSIKAPMPGSVIDVNVKAGDNVQNGDVLLILEAMKMENELTSSTAGTVTEVLVKKGDTVNSGDPLVIIA